VANPTLPACQVINPQTGGETQTPVALAQQSTVNLINSRTPAAVLAPAASAAGGSDGKGGGEAAPDKTEQQAGPATGTTPGVKNEKPAAKMYCN
jgi:hypothetical protein